MRVAHIADLHLGFRQFDRGVSGSTDGVYGQNQREADVFSTFRRLIDDLIAVRPHVIVVAGDILHTFRPSNATILEVETGFRRLVTALPGTPIVVAAGNHDLPRTKETAVILTLLRPLGVHVATWEAERFSFPDLDLSVLAVPDAMGMTAPDLTPDPTARYNVLVMHGEAQEARQTGSARSHGASADGIAAAPLAADGWSYVAMGHYHQYEQLGPHAYYSGSIDFTSSNPWAEIGVPKGFIVEDLETGEHAFVQLPPSRAFVDLTLSAAGLAPDTLSAALAELLSPSSIDNAVVRVVVTDCERSLFRDVDPVVVRAARKRALNLAFDIRKPEIIRIGSTSVAGRRQSLDEIVSAFLGKRFAAGTDLSLEAITRLSNGYLADATSDLERVSA